MKMCSMRMTKFTLVLRMVAMSMFLQGCGEVEQQPVETTTEDTAVEEHADVKLSDVEEPIVGERYLVLATDDSEFDVCYGQGYPVYLDVNSGLPGFGYPMLMKGEDLSDYGDVTVTAEYGEYVYSYAGDCEGVDSINFGQHEELLYLYSTDSGECKYYRLVRGPVVGV